MELDVLPFAEIDLTVDDDDIIEFKSEPNHSMCETQPTYESGSYEIMVEQDPLNYNEQVNAYEDDEVQYIPNPTVTNRKEKIRRFQCEECGKYFIRRDHLKNHRRTHTGERPFECDICHRFFAKKLNVQRHKEYIHGSVMTFFMCEKCGKTVTRKDHLKTHMLSHQDPTLKPNNGYFSVPKTFTCETCGRAYCKLESLNKHMERHLEAAKSDSDVICKDFKFHFMSSNNQQRKNDVLKPHACEYCGKLFVRKDHLKYHERTHTGERPYPCNQCDKRFAKRFILTRHIQNVHRTDSKIHECSECNRKFGRVDHLKIHLKAHFFETVRTQPNYKIFRCGICEREFTSSDDLKTHMRTHFAKEQTVENTAEQMASTNAAGVSNYSFQNPAESFYSLNQIQLLGIKQEKNPETS